MKNLRTAFAAAIFAAALLLLLAPGASTEAAPNNDVLVDVIIGFDSAPGASEEALVRGLGGQISHRYTIVPGMAASIPESAIAALRNNPNVAAVDLDGQVQAIDAELDNAWGVAHIGSGDVQTAGNSGAGVTLAVIDTGIGDGSAAPHPDLAVVAGFDYVDGDSIPQDGYGHGTHVAGTACALDNNIGVVGVAPGCALYNLRVLNNSGGGSWSDILAAIDYTAANNISVANLSLGGSSYPGSTVEQGFANAATSGVVIVAAAGNSGTRRGKGDSVGYPARFDSVIAVAATDSSDKRASFSSTGPDLEISAPGVGVNSTVPTGNCSMCTSSGYRTANGTSMASPHVAGVAALMIAAGVTDVRGQLSATAIPLGSASQYGAGLVDAPGAVASGVAPAPTPTPDPTLGTLSGIVTAADGGAVIEGASVNVDGTSLSALTDGNGNYTIAKVPTGVQSVTASRDGFVSVSQGLTVDEDPVITAANFALGLPPPPPDLGTLEVASIDYSTSGGKKADRHLDISVLVTDGSNAVEGVVVAVTVYRNGADYGSATATTGADGRAAFRASRAPSGDYTTDVTSLNGVDYVGEPDPGFTK